MLRRTHEATRAWDAEVDAEAARLIERGIPPFDAVIRAREIVSARRRNRAASNTQHTEQK